MLLRVAALDGRAGDILKRLLCHRQEAMGRKENRGSGIRFLS